MPFSVLVVDDTPSVVQVLSLLLGTDVRFAVAGTAEDGLEALPIIRESCPASVIVMYTSDPGQAQTARRLGADDVVDKTADPTTLIDIVAELCTSSRPHHD